MNKELRRCDDRMLIGLLEGDDIRVEHQWIAHLDDCPHCQLRLRELAASDGEWQVASEAMGDSRVGACEWTRARERRAAPWNETLIRPLLGPPTHPEMLGRLGRYEIERLIGSGGMGIVFKAYDTELNRAVAVKVLTPFLATETSANKRFSREARAAAGVIDDHVVPIYNVESDNEPPYFVMQYVAGGALQDKLERDGPLQFVEVVRIGLHVARGLAAAHSQGLIHRDVKPSNILLDEGVERALISDFGLARAENEDSLTCTGFHPGTPQYMSPEQIQGEEIDGRSDLFGLGCVLYALLTGRPPFHAESQYAVLRRVTDHEPQPLHERRSDVPAWLAAIVGKLLRKPAAERFQSAKEVADLFEGCLAHLQHPTRAALPSFEIVEASSKRWRMKRWSVSLVLLCLIVAGSFASWGQVKSNASESRDEVNAVTPRERDAMEERNSHENQPLEERDELPRPSLEEILARFQRHERNYLPYHVKSMNTFRLNEALTAAEKRSYPWADGRDHRKRMEYAQRELGVWLRKELMLVDGTEQSRFDQYVNAMQGTSVTSRPGSDPEVVHQPAQMTMVFATPYAGLFPLAVYGEGLLLTDAIASGRTTATLEWDQADAVLEFHYGWKDNPMRFRLWLSREHGWHPVKLQRFNNASSKSYFSQWQAKEFRKVDGDWRVEKGSMAYRHFEEADNPDAKVIYCVDFDVLSAEFGESVARDRFQYDVPRHAKIRSVSGPKKQDAPQSLRPMKVVVKGVGDEPILGASVRFRTTEFGHIETRLTGEDGTATVTEVPSRVHVDVSANGYRTASWINGPRGNESSIVLVPKTTGTTRDPSGKVIPDVWITSEAPIYRKDGVAHVPRHEFAGVQNDWSDEAGRFALTQSLTIFNRDEEIPIVAIDDSGEQMSISFVPPSRLAKPLELILRPVCHVHGEFVFEAVDGVLDLSAEVLDSKGRRIARLTPRVRLDDGQAIVSLKVRLPPGCYQLKSYGAPSRPDFCIPLVVAPDRKELDFGSIPIAAAGLASLIGQPAPELDVCTRTGQDLSLSDLKGNLVVVNFWAHWCLPCVRSMPQLMELKDEFANQPVRWILIHEPSLKSFEKLDGKTKQFEQTVWDRPMSFDSVIDRSTVPLSKNGVTASRYGVHVWPTLVLIDAEGTVVGGIAAADLKSELERLLATNPKDIFRQGDHDAARDIP